MQLRESKTSTHFWVSMIKSGIRILGAIALMFGDLELGGLLLIAAEIAGIVEEL